MEQLQGDMSKQVNSRVSDAVVEYFRVNRDELKENLKSGRNTPPAALKNYIIKQIDKKFASTKSEDELVSS